MRDTKIDQIHINTKPNYLKWAKQQAKTLKQIWKVDKHGQNNTPPEATIDRKTTQNYFSSEILIGIVEL